MVSHRWQKKLIGIGTSGNDVWPISFAPAYADAGAVDQKAASYGQWLLTDLKELIETIAQAGENSSRLISRILARLSRACHLGQKATHAKGGALAREIRLGLGSRHRLCQPS